MNIYLFVSLFVITYFLLNKDVSCKGRGGGGRGGGSRSGGSRSSSSRIGSSRSSGYRSGSTGYRSGSSGFRSSGGIPYRTIVLSPRYSSWSVRVGVVPSTRYKVSPWSTQHQAILAGHIIMSSHQRSRFQKSYYDDISVCYNEEPIYNRNVTASPWFICPWDDISERFCCGDEVEERCCQYFERTGHMASLVIGIILIILLAMLVLFWYLKSRPTQKDTTVIYTTENKMGGEFATGEAAVLIYPPSQANDNLQTITNPAYNNLPCPTYESTTENNLPYPSGAPGMEGNLPYPSDPMAPCNGLPYPMNSGIMDNNVQYNATAPMDYQSTYPNYAPTADNVLPYPTNPIAEPGYSSTGPGSMMPTPFNAPPTEQYPSQSPPSYDDALKIKNQ